jgi:cyclopropane fatty-acyl-phospholipid synthase-like methyltransferase
MTQPREFYRERTLKKQGSPALVALVGSQPFRVLDIGCGAGANLRLLEEWGHAATGLTLSETEAGIVEEQSLSCRGLGYYI